jgi:hypothetical protein
MDLDLLLSCTTGLVIVGLIASQVVRRDFDPFAPVWLFLAGYAQVYVIQAISYREYALRMRGAELVTAANFRALWALLWFLLVYYSGIGRRIAARLPRAPAFWSPGLVAGVTPLMILWGLACSGVVLTSVETTQDENLLRQFPIMMLAAGVLLIVTGRQPTFPRPFTTLAGVLVVAAYVVIWMFNGRRSHAVIGVLTGVSAWYLPSWRRPSVPAMAVTGVCCALVVSLALGWRNNARYETTPAGFVEYLGDFDPSTMLVNLNLKERDEETPGLVAEQKSKETEEYGGFLLMMDTVPEKSEYDYGASYLRLFSTYIPRLVWKDKPIFGREQWVKAWIKGSEFNRDMNFTGPAIGVLGATQLNGGAIATLIVLAYLALLLRTGYDYFRFYSDRPWAQFWWSITYYVAWLMTVNDDPMVWFYYIYGHTTLPPVVALWLYHRVRSPAPTPASGVAV